MARTGGRLFGYQLRDLPRSGEAPDGGTMIEVVVRSVEVRVTGGARSQRAVGFFPDYHGKRVCREFWFRVERGSDPYPVGVYQLSDRSVFVDRYSSALAIFPRLEFVRDLSQAPAASGDGALLSGV